MHDAAFASVESVAAVNGGAVVPDEEIADAPSMRPGEFRLHAMRPKPVEQALARGEILGKGTTVEQALEMLKTIHGAGIATKAFIMLGAPGETTETLRATQNFVLQAPLDDVMISFFTPFPGAELSHGIEKKGKVTGDYSAMSEHRVTFVPTDVTEDILLNFRRRLYRRFYLRPRAIRHYLRRLREPSGRPVLIGAAKAFLRQFVFGRKTQR